MASKYLRDWPRHGETNTFSNAPFRSACEASRHFIFSIIFFKFCLSAVAAQPQAKSSDSSSSTGAKANTRAGPAAPEINEVHPFF